MVKVVVFDMDDTLYHERSYVSSGFLAVDGFLCARLGTPKGAVAKACEEILAQQGRGKIFDTALSAFGIYSKTLVRRCLHVYRHHTPAITLLPDATACLERLKALHVKLYVVTDGHKIVQANKANALGLARWMEHVFITHRYGTLHAKPSPYCFEKICAREGVAPREVLYVGDNPHKDFVGIKPLGFQTVRIMRGMFAEVEKEAAYEAERRIETLEELPTLLGIKGSQS